MPPNFDLSEIRPDQLLAFLGVLIGAMIAGSFNLVTKRVTSAIDKRKTTADTEKAKAEEEKAHTERMTAEIEAAWRTSNHWRNETDHWMAIAQRLQKEKDDREQAKSTG